MRRREKRHIVAGKLYPTRRGYDLSRNNFDKSTLSSTVFSKYRVNLPLLHIERNIFQRKVCPVSLTYIG